MSALTLLSATQMAEQIRNKKTSPVELLEAHLARIEKVNPGINAFVQLDTERALTQADDAEAAVMHNHDLGLLHGVPLSIKSSIDVAGLRCEVGTRLRAGHVASTDAPLVARLRKAGAIILGVTNTPELLMAWETDNLLYGRTNNPWDLSRTAGGSSGGEAAAIASGCSAGGVGSDGGGSIRVPAHFCGICGLKATPGRIPAIGHFPLCVGPFTVMGVVGPMARTVKDLKLLFEVMQGPDVGDLSAAPVPVRWPSPAELKNARIGYFEDDGRTPVTPETRVAVRRAAEALRHSGFEVEPFHPEGLESARQLWWKFFGGAGGMLLAPMTRGLCPVASVPAFRHGERSWQVEGKTVQYLDAWSYCEWFNLLGMPGAVVPVSQTSEGLPIGVQIGARPWEEELVLEIAEVIERECGSRKSSVTV